jgi:hypothetical protein
LSCFHNTQTHAPVSAGAHQCLRTVDTGLAWFSLLSLYVTISRPVSVLVQYLLRARAP